MNRAAMVSLALGVAAASCQSEDGCQGRARESVLLQVAHTHESQLGGIAATSRKDKCEVNDHVSCPYSGVRCSGNQCCPGTNETGGLNFVCPSASSVGPWLGRCQLLTKVEDCTEALVAHPISNAWRVRAGSTESGWAWDVRTLTFKDAGGNDLQLGTCQALSSGSVSDAEHGGILGNDAENAFNASGAWWGGRSDSTGKFFLGLLCEQQYEVAQVQIQQSDRHFAQEVTVEWLDEDGNWVPLQTASGLLGGRIAGSPEDWSMERIYPNLDWVGCFVDDKDRHLDAGPGGYGYSTSSCSDACKGFKYMALQHQGECRCGDRLSSEEQYTRTDDAECGAVCVGEEQSSPTRFCGADWRNAVYRIGGTSGESSTPSTDGTSSTTSSPSGSMAGSTTAQSTSMTTGAFCKFRVASCTLPGLPFGAPTVPPPENWELMVGECSPDGRGGAYKVDKPSSSNPFDPECGPASPYYVHVEHYPEESCMGESDNSSFTVFTDGNCGNCCDIQTGVCNSGCRGFLSPA